MKKYFSVIIILVLAFSLNIGQVFADEDWTKVEVETETETTTQEETDKQEEVDSSEEVETKTEVQDEIEANTYKDIESHWALEEINACVEKGIFNLSSRGIFGPNTPITRGLFVSAMGRIDGVQVGTYLESSFEDVSTKSLYFDYVQWAYENGIVNGVGNNLFSPNNEMTREQMAVIIINYLEYMGVELPEENIGLSFGDGDNISDWAKSAVARMQVVGLVKGVNETDFAPKKNVTRAEVATVLNRLTNIYVATESGITASEVDIAEHDNGTKEVPENADRDYLFGVNKEVYCSVNEFGVYGKSLNIDGSIEFDKYNYSNIELSLVLRNTMGEEIELPVDYDKTETDEKTVFSFSTIKKYNNQGFDLEKIGNEHYIVLLKIQNIDTFISDYYPLIDKSTRDDLIYYTITRNGSNNRITAGFEDILNDVIELENETLTFENIMTLISEVAPLPENVYDIAIDVGHGGIDGGAVYGKYIEKDINLKVALMVRDLLESNGLKVYMTRTGDTPKEKYVSKAIYDEDGRINNIGSSNAKLCISIHANSSYGYNGKGGVEVYCPYRSNTYFGKYMIDAILANVDTKVSQKVTNKVGYGIYQKKLSISDMNLYYKDALMEGYEPYDIYDGTDYYYIIRETGGIYTGAIMDGRDENYGRNRYCNSNKAVETYIVEMGYMNNNEDLNSMLSFPEKYAKGIVEGILSYLK